MQVANTSATPFMKQNDENLAAFMRAAQSGDTHAYTQLLKTVTPRLRAIIRQHRRFLQSDQIEDLVQDVLLSVHAVRATYDPERPFMPWLMAIMPETGWPTAPDGTSGAQSMKSRSRSKNCL